jgi:DNA replication terminus site-binding protein (Ter protein)
MPSHSPSNSALRAELGATLDHLQKAISLLTTHLRYHTRAAWVWHTPRGKPADFTSPPPDLPSTATLQLIIDTIEAIEYTDDQDAHDSRIAPGIIVLSEDGIPLADEVNRLKRALASVLRRMQDRTEAGIVNPATGERGPRPLREVALEAFFFRRLHHWQATRELTILRTKAGCLTTPDYIGFTWSSCRDVRRTTREALLEQLKEKRLSGDDSPLYDQDIEILSALPKKEPLALVKPGHTKPVANVAWPALSGKEPERQIRPAVLPLIMVGDRLPERLRKLPAAPTPQHLRRTRSDMEIEPNPILVTLPAYRYSQGFRSAKRTGA